MKKSISYLLTILFFLTFSFTKVSATETEKPKATATEQQLPQEIQQLVNRVYEIREMDKSKLSTAQRKDLKKELRGIKSELKAVSGIYLSLGALIIIILLLILIL